MHEIDVNLEIDAHELQNMTTILISIKLAKSNNNLEWNQVKTKDGSNT